ncbi:MAG: pyridoxamine 5'-phosphate oxidase family protein [Candidatus Colwellbacteria bacterium]|nr:pyridoxamine 5'-phosphate oxidase family protein [Candidatus Colwellbacteria bacterium]
MSAKLPNEQEVRRRVVAYLERNRLMVVATVADSTPWAATVFFAYDQNLNLYFYSREDTRHCREIARNPRVAVAVSHAQHAQNNFVRGVQMTGEARKVSAEGYAAAYARYRERFAWADRFSSDHVLYRIAPRQLWCIDEELLGHFNRVRVV